MNAYYTPNPLTADDLGEHTPKRGGNALIKKSAAWFLKYTGWRLVGELPNIPQAVLLAAPHTSNMDGVFAIPTVLALDVNIRLLGKKELFSVPILSHILRFAGVIPIDRSKKGSVLEANIARFKTGEPLFLGLAPEGTRKRTDTLKTGFYYLAVGAGVPIVPVAMDYAKKEIRFMQPFYPTGDIEADLPAIIRYYQGVTPKHPENLATPLKNADKA